MNCIAKSASHIGKVRKKNEDSFKTGKCYAIVADGMGGHNKGETASKMAVETISKELAKKKALVMAFEKANKEIYNKAQKEDAYQGMGTTAVACMWEENVAYIANVGDSRGYLLRGNKLKQITKDHSLVQQMVDRGEITRNEAEKRPDKNIILRALGAEENINVDMFEINLFNDDMILLCTDGLTGCVKDKDIEKILRDEKNLQNALDLLVEKANKHGGEDNITAVLLKFCEELSGGTV